MKYGVLAVAVALLLSFPRTTGVDVAKLHPVEVLSVTHSDGQIQIQTDTGASGRGKDLKTAIENLNHSTAAVVFLDTAEYLLLDGAGKALLPELMQYLRPACGVCLVEGEQPLDAVAQYLRTHPPAVTLLKYRAGMTALQTLKINGEGMALVS